MKNKYKAVQNPHWKRPGTTSWIQYFHVVDCMDQHAGLNCIETGSLVVVCEKMAEVFVILFSFFLGDFYRSGYKFYLSVILLSEYLLL